MEKKILMKSKAAAPNLLRALHSLYRLGHLCDVTVLTQHLGIQEEFLAHKAVLAASSNYFKGLFLHQEMLDTQKCTVTLQDIYTEEFTSFLEFVYTAEVEIEAGKLQRMKEIAERLECKDLLDICEEVKAEGRKGLDLSLHLKGQKGENRGSQWPCIQQEENPRNSSQVMAIPVQRRLWDRQKHKELLPGYELIESQAGGLEQEATAFPAPKSRPAKLPMCNKPHSPARLGVDIASLENKDGHSLGRGQEQKRESQACPYCDKAISSKCGLAVHVRTHTGDGPYRCQRCPASFAHRAAYTSHLRKTHESGQERKLLPVYWMVVPPTHGPNPLSRDKDPDGETWDGTPETSGCEEDARNSSVAEAERSKEQEESQEAEGGNEDEGGMSVKGEGQGDYDTGYSEVEGSRDNEECSEEEEEEEEDEASTKKDSKEPEPGFKLKKASKNVANKKSIYVIQCDKCQEQFVSRKKYVDHCRDVHQSLPGKVYRCEVCSKAFASYTSWKEHRACVHSEERRFSCGLCQATFKRKRDVRTHSMRKHEGRAKRPLCSVCGKILSSRTALVFHMRTHTGEKPYECGVCHSRFAQPSQLKIHTRSHTGEKPYICEDCGASFADKGKLTGHKRTHTGERLFRCDVCGKHFATNEYLKCHKRCHLGAKPYRCEVCGKAFGLRASLAQHSNVHAETRPYFCEQCGKAFTQQGALRRHQRIHTGEKPYKCRACDRTFTDMSTLRRHVAIHDRNAHWRSFLIDFTQKKNHNWSKIETLVEAHPGGDPVPEIWSVDHGKLYKPGSAKAAAAHVTPGLGNTGDTDPSLLYL